MVSPATGQSPCRGLNMLHIRPPYMYTIQKHTKAVTFLNFDQSLTKFHNFNRISQFQPNFTIKSEQNLFHNRIAYLLTELRMSALLPRRQSWGPRVDTKNSGFASSLYPFCYNCSLIINADPPHCGICGISSYHWQ